MNTDNIKKIHLTGVCGIAMGTLALMFLEKGYDVSGSDSGFYPPMSDLLEQSDIKLYKKFNEDNVKDADLVVIGNSISRGNVEAEAVLNNRISYISMASAIQKYFMDGKEVISISGTHGKSTTTALLAHILESAGEEPSFFLGGVANNFNSNYKIGKGKYFVIEGDEYDSAFFEKVPKFILYRPHHLALTSLEFDHADIFSSLDEIKLWFKRLVNIIPSNGKIVFCSGYENLHDIISGSMSDISSFNEKDADYIFAEKGMENDETILEVGHGDEKTILKTKVFGKFNYLNILSALSMALSLGIDRDSIIEGVRTFSGVKRRQDLIFSEKNIKVYEDFAHHPTAIDYVLSSMRDRFKESKIIAVYEPRSATSRRNIFQDELPRAFRHADKVLVKNPYALESIESDERLDASGLCNDIINAQGDASLFFDVNDIVDDIVDSLDKSCENVIVIMSNGSFDGIYNIIKKRLHQTISI